MQNSDLIESISITLNETILAAAKVLSKTGLRVVLIVDHEKKLLGVVTDSDLRKAIVKAIDLDASVSSIMVADPVLAKEDDSKEHVLRQMKIHNVHEVPRVNEQGQVIAIDFFHHMSDVKTNDANVLIMAGGMGKRLHPLTLKTPKPLLPVRGVPMLERIIASFVEQGFKQVYVSLCYRSEDFVRYFTETSKIEVEITWLIEESPLGTAGALSMLPKEQNHKDLLVSNADLDSDICYQSIHNFHRQNHADITIAAKRYAYQVPFGVIEHQHGCVESIVEKPEYVKYINGGLYVLSPSVYASIVKQEPLDMPDLQVPLFCDVFLSIGDIAKRSRYFEIFKNRVVKNNIMHHKSFQEDGVVMGESNQVFANSYINSGVKIGCNNIINTGSIIEHETKIESHSHISVQTNICGRVSIGSFCFIGAGATVIDGISICSHVTIGAGSVVIHDIDYPGVYVGNPTRRIR